MAQGRQIRGGPRSSPSSSSSGNVPCTVFLVLSRRVVSRLTCSLSPPVYPSSNRSSCPFLVDYRIFYFAETPRGRMLYESSSFHCLRVTLFSTVSSHWNSTNGVNFTCFGILFKVTRSLTTVPTIAVAIVGSINTYSLQVVLNDISFLHFSDRLILHYLYVFQID